VAPGEFADVEATVDSLHMQGMILVKLSNSGRIEGDVQQAPEKAVTLSTRLKANFTPVRDIPLTKFGWTSSRKSSTGGGQNGRRCSWRWPWMRTITLLDYWISLFYSCSIVYSSSSMVNWHCTTVVNMILPSLLLVVCGNGTRQT
jgi:hypothetical protein